MSDDFWVKQLAKARRTPVQASHPYNPNQPPTHQAQPKPWWDTTPDQQLQPPPARQQPAEYRPAQAQSVKQSARCPDCQRENYMLVARSPFEVWRCFNCSPMQSVAAVQNTGGESVQPARQVSTENNYNPGVIVAKA